ncbi:hypothetical protein QE419_002644 [Brevundimonas vesicularis]|uniref:hypothetical protein n=1 Tax=Brevundimonas vesicularis TaxID=41276 RepID=UPI0027831385|nr:hypothetical protein [Brevundimonas vesicularis]MDQ1193878.1 hypothetical protein [Brevundimonas vesicularis]
MDDPLPNMSVAYVDGLALGMVIQFGTGDWRDGSVRGVAISEEAFDKLEPAIRIAIPDWYGGARHIVTAVTPASLRALVAAIGTIVYEDPRTMKMIGQVNDWLALTHRRGEAVSIFGI